MTFAHWPTDFDEADNVQAAVPQMYKAGFAGVVEDVEADAAIKDVLPWQTFADVAASFPHLRRGNHQQPLPGVDESGLFLPYLAQVKCEAIELGINGSLAELSADERINPWPEAQTCGDCVSHWLRGATDICRSVEVMAGEPEAWVARGATEVAYGHRNHRGHGASCSRLLSYVMEVGGMILRQKHDVPDFGTLDLRKYDASIGTRWGGSGVPKSVNRFCSGNRMREATKCNTVEEIKLAFENGLSVGGCSSMGFSSTRDDWGVSKPRGSWSHAMNWHGADFRPSTLRKYSSGLVLIQQSWGLWNKGPRKIHGTPYLIPKGAFWADLNYVRRHAGGFWCLSGANGWQLPPLQDLGSW